MHDDDLAELLALADSGRTAPPDFEEALLANVLATLESGSDAPSQPVESDVAPVLVPDDGPAPVEVGGAELLVLPSAHPSGSGTGRSRHLAVAFAAAAVVALVLFIGSITGDGALVESGPVATSPADDITALTDVELCRFFDDEVVTSDVPNDVTSDELERIADLLAEVAARGLVDMRVGGADDVDQVVTTLRYAALTAEQGADDASTALRQAQSALQSLRLRADSCTI